ncbi:MAG: M48 family metallopeptidase [Bacteroidaceae bacterium]|nr:M48 family metallopeptidase [Bacteroidaceae bacterium]
MNAKDIMHPDDAKAIQAMQKMKGFDKFVRVYMNLGYEAIYRGENMANMLLVTEESFPEIHAAFQEVVNKVGISEPLLYIYNDPVVNAFTYGETDTFVALSSGLIECMDIEELKGVMAHECGHILCKHTLYMTMLETIKNIGSFFKLINYSLLGPVFLAMQYWSRKSELSADRCGAAVVGEGCYQRVLLKLASGMKNVSNNTRELIEQGKSYLALKRASLWNRVQLESRSMFYSHPQLCVRALELDRWKDSYTYRILNVATKYN